MLDFDLQKIFQSSVVVDMPTLLKLSHGRSRRSLFRDLNLIKYISSYSHAGKFYSLASIPSFDLYGLWQYGNIFFSKYGTLKTTLRVLITDSSAGFTHNELRCLLRIPIQNTLNDLIRGKSIDRERVNNLFLYVSFDKKTTAQQLANRREQITIADPNASTTIEVLLELLHSENWHPESISRRLRVKNILVSGVQIRNIFLQYSIKKKTFT